MDASSDRRRQQRLDKVFAVYIRGAWGSSFAIARNISRGGMFLETSDPYPLGSRMEITFQWPGSTVEMTAVGEVVHVCFVNTTAAGGRRRPQAGIGVRFTGLVERPQLAQAAGAELLQ